MCGENITTPALHAASAGSPPRVRGKPGYLWKVLGLKRITPACAGKTFLSLHPQRHRWDHPRVCGENGKPGRSQRTSWGSPPRVRGKQESGKTRSRVTRITPACAGKTKCRRHLRISTEDHPRVCGENKRLVSKF